MLSAVDLTRSDWLVARAVAARADAAQSPFIGSICSVIFAPNTPLPEMFARVKSARFDAVELRLDVDLTAADRTGAIARDHGIEIASLWVSQPLSHHPL